MLAQRSTTLKAGLGGLIMLALLAVPAAADDEINSDYDTQCFHKAPREEPDGYAEALTADGITLKMRRYRPAPDASFNEGGQPILLFTGIVCNMDQFLSRTPDGPDGEPLYDLTKADLLEYAEKTPGLYEAEMDTCAAPEPYGLGEWAIQGRDEKGNPIFDKYVDEDPMKYFSIAHMFWLKGYDPWFVNYRGTGRGIMRSGDISDIPEVRWYDFRFDEDVTNLDLWACLDTQAAINRVWQTTRQWPVIGGHSTGGLVSYAYLEGAYFIRPELTADGTPREQDDRIVYNEADRQAFIKAIRHGYVPHVQQSNELARLRNDNIKGFIALDPAVTPLMPSYLNLDPVWALVGLPVKIPLGELIDEVVKPLIGPDTLITLEDVLFDGLFALDGALDLSDILGPACTEDFVSHYITCWDMRNMHPCTEDFMARYGVSSFYMRGLDQYVEFALNDTLREHWKNGEENMDALKGFAPYEGDGYYYYFDDRPGHTNNMELVDVPIVALLSRSDSLVCADKVKKQLLDAKTPDPRDTAMILPCSAHVDVPLGLYSASRGFDLVASWLDEVFPAGNDTAATEDAPESAQNIAGEAVSGDDDGGCFIATAR